MKELLQNTLRSAMAGQLSERKAVNLAERHREHDHFLEIMLPDPYLLRRSFAMMPESARGDACNCRIQLKQRIFN